MHRSVFLVALISVLATAPMALAESIPAIARRIPPKGIEVPQEVRTKLTKRLATLKPLVQKLSPEVRPDVEIFTKAVEFALANGEFFHKRDFAAAEELLTLAEKRIQQAIAGESSWQKDHGLVVRGFRSDLDQSVQPYGLVIPEKLSFEKPVKLYVWLHGRGDKTTDLQFIHQRLHRVGTVHVQDGIILHPFGRYCNAFKFAGEVDVFESIEAVKRDYNIDDDRIVLWGFSMGGAGVWHLAAHHPDKWVAASPGAGFAETAKYQRLKPENFPVWYEQKLWNMFDAPSYTRNLFNLPVIAYSGEKDRQIQAARVMEEAFEEHGRKLPHLIGPKMGHKYHPEVLQELTQKLSAIATKGRDDFPKTIEFQTRTLQYSRCYWLQILGLGEHWEDARVTADRVADNQITLATKNVTSLAVHPFLPGKEKIAAGLKLIVDGQQVHVPATVPTVVLTKTEGHWHIGELSGQRKKPGLQGPIDDAFTTPFLVVTPDRQSGNSTLDRWMQFEIEHLRDRWRRLFRADLPEKKASEVTTDDLQRYNLVLWGTPETNQWIQKAISELPIRWTNSELAIDKEIYPAKDHVPALIYPNPLKRSRYLVLNSGLTFREDHDRTNSLQNPKLPDWAVIDLAELPSGSSPGRIDDAGFFDEQWKFKAK